MPDPSSPLPPRERRAWVRYPCNLPTLYQPGSGRLDHQWWFAKVRDLSTHGIGLILERHFDPGTLLTIALYSESAEVSCTVEATVAHISEQAPREWVVGCAFTTPISEDDLRAFWSEQRLSQALSGKR
jgi:hypothetical protein